MTEPAALTEEQQKKLRELDEAIAKFESQKRWSDVIKNVLAKVDVVTSVEEKVGYLNQAATLYIERSSNQAEAIKSYEAILELDRANIGAILQLKELYDKRKDWEKLIRTMDREAELLDASDRGLRYEEMAKLATERLRKPEICIDLWKKVLEYEPDHGEGLGALAGLYERAKEWAPLADVLEKQLDRATAAEEIKGLLQKLGMIYSDKLSNEDGALKAYERLLDIDPEDKRAQEQLKRRYIAAKAWDELERFYAPSGKWDELIRTLDREASNKDAPATEQIDLHFRIARLWERLDKNDRAAKSLEKVLELDPENLDAAASLSPIFEASGDFKRLSGVLEILGKGTEDPDVKVAHLVRLASVYEEQLKKPDQALDKLLSAFAAEPTKDLVRSELLRLAHQQGAAARVVDAYEAAVGNVVDADAQIALRRELAGLLPEVGRAGDAVTHLESILDLKPDDLESLNVLDELYRSAGRFEELLRIYDRKIELEEDSQARRRAHYSRASLLTNELADAGRASDAYQAIIDEWGDEEYEAFAALEQIYENAGRFDDLAALIERQIDQGPSDEAVLVALKFRLSRVAGEHQNAHDRALELLREVLMLSPDHEAGRAALERYLERADLGAAAAEILEPIYEAQGEWGAVVRATLVLAEADDDPVSRLTRYSRIADIFEEQLGNPVEAFVFRAKAFEQDPSSEAALGQVLGLAESVGKHSEVVELLERCASGVTETTLSRALLLRAAAIRENNLADIDGAVRAYQRVLDIEPGDPEVLDALESLYTRNGNARELLGVLRQKVDATSDIGEQEELLLRMATLHDGELKEPSEATVILRELLEQNPTHENALRLLGELLERQELWAELADHLQRRIDLSGDVDEQTGLMLSLANIQQNRMGAVDASIEILRDVLERDPQNPTAHAALEALLQGSHQNAVADILEPVYRDLGAFDRLIRVHEVQALAASSPDRRLELFERIAELYEVAVDRPDLAFDAHARALAEDPSRQDVQDQLERLAVVSDKVETLASLYETRAESLLLADTDGAAAGDLLARAALYREEHLGQLDKAIELYQRLLAREPGRVEATEALERLFQAGERYEELAQVLLKKGEADLSDDDRKHALSRAGAIYEELLSRPEAAVAAYERVREIDPDDERALDKLIELYLSLEQWQPLLSVYEQKADMLTDADEKKRLYLEVGAVYEREIGDSAKAIDTFQRILELDPTDAIAISRLDALYQRTEQWPELLEILERESELALDPNDVAAARFRIASTWDAKLGDQVRAIESYRSVLEVDPDHGPTVDALEQMIGARRSTVDAAALLEWLYQERADWRNLVRVLEVSVGETEGAESKVGILHRIADIAEMQMSQPRLAFDAYRRALPLEPQNEHTVESLDRLSSELSAHSDFAAALDHEIERMFASEADRYLAQPLAMRAALLYETAVGDHEKAAARYRTVLELEPSNYEAMESLDRIYLGQENWVDLAEILSREVDAAPSGDIAIEHQFRLGQVKQFYLGDVAGAIERYGAILEADGSHQGAVESLEQLFAEGVELRKVADVLEPVYRMQESWDKLLGVEQVALGHDNDPASRVEAMHKMAELAESQASDPQTALEWHLRVLLEVPSDEQSLVEAERLTSGLGQWEQLTDVLVRAADVETDGTRRIGLASRVASIYEEQLLDPARAAESYLFVLTLAPDDQDALRALERIFEENGAAEGLQQILAARARYSDDSRDKVDLLYRRAQVLSVDLGRTDDAIAVYRELLDKHDREHEDSIRSLTSLYAERGDYQSLRQAFEYELGIASSDHDRAAVMTKMARVSQQYLNDDIKAAEYWNGVLELAGEDVEALNSLGEIHARAGRWDDVVQALDREAMVHTDDAVRSQIYCDLGRVVYQKLKDPRGSLDQWQRALDVDPSSTDALFAMSSIYQEVGQHEDQAESLLRVAQVGAGELDDSLLESVFLKVGELYERQLNQPRDAVDVYKKAVEVSPTSLEAISALERIFRADSQPQDLVEALELRVNATAEPEGRVPVLLEIGELWKGPLASPGEGIPAYQRVVQIDPTHALAVSNLVTLYTGESRWEDLVELYLGQLEQESAVPKRVGLLRKVAAIQENHLNDLEQAFGALQIAWEENVFDRETIAELERVTAAAQKWNELLASANNALAAATDQSVSISINLCIAKWYGAQLGRPEYAQPYYQKVLALDPSNVPAMQQLADLYRTTRDYSSLAQVLGRLVTIASDPKDKASVFVQMGDLCEDHLGVPEQATAYYEQALEAVPSDLDAINALERVYLRDQRWDGLLDVLSRKAKSAPDVSVKVEAKLLSARVMVDQLGQYDRAIDVYREVLTIDDAEVQAVRGLEQLYESLDRKPELLEIVERSYELATTERDRVHYLLKAGGMYEVDFLKGDRAAERFEQVLDVDPNNDEALSSLERIYRSSQKWDDLLRTLDRHVSATSDRAEKQYLLGQLGDVYEIELKDVDRAVDVQNSVLDINPDNVNALGALSRLYEKRGDAAQAVEVLSQLASRVGDPAEAVDLRFRTGRILDEQLGDRAAALESYQGALDIDSGHVPSLEAIKNIYLSGGDWLAAARALEQMSENQPQPRLSARTLVELGKLYEEKLEDPERAFAVFQAAYGRDAENEEAAFPLANYYVRERQYESALPLLDELVKRSQKRSPEEQHQLALQLGKVALELGQHEVAQKALTKAQQLQPQDAETLSSLAESFYVAKNWEQAFKFYQMLLVHHRDGMRSEQSTDVFFRLGVIKREQGDRRKALNMFDKALEEDPTHQPTMEAIVELYTNQGEWEQVVHFKRKLSDTQDGPVRLRTLEEIGDLWSEKEKNPAKAIQAYREAIDLDPPNHRIHLKLLQLLTGSKQWEPAIDIIEKMMDGESAPGVKARLAYTAASILRDSVGDVDRALEYFNRALDYSPGHLKAFEAINRVLTTKKDWKQLERAFRKMLHRLMGQEASSELGEGEAKAEPELLHSLWHNLGLIYRDRLKQPENSVEAFRMASSIKPEDLQEHHILAELYASIGQTDNAIAEQQFLLKKQPDHPEIYQALYRLYFDARAYDKAWCVAAALSFMNQADEEQKQFFEQYRSKEPQRLRSRVDEERWFTHLTHPDQDLVLSKLFAQVWSAVLAIRRQSDADAGLSKKSEVEVATSDVAIAQTFRAASQWLNVPAPRLYLRPDVQGGGILHRATWPVASICTSNVLSGLGVREMLFLVGKHLSDYRPEHYIRTLLPSTEQLKAVVVACLRMVNLAPADPASDQLAAQIRAHLQQNSPAALDNVGRIARRFVDEGARADVKKWLQMVELTSCRAGFLITGDLDVASKTIRSIPSNPVDLPVKEKIWDLVLFSVSEEYFQLRQSLGIQISVA